MQIRHASEFNRTFVFLERVRHKPELQDPWLVKPREAHWMIPSEWQNNARKAAREIGKRKLTRFFSLQAPCGSGKSMAQIFLAVDDVVASRYRQKQLITVPQQHIHASFSRSDDLQFKQVLLNGKNYVWQIDLNHNFCDGNRADIVNRLKNWLLTPAHVLSRGFREKTISGINAICSHAALGRVWRILTAEEKLIALRNLTLRVDEYHHISHVYMDDELIDLELLREAATELGRICTEIVNTNDDTCKLHVTSATPFRGSGEPILSAMARDRFKTFIYPWIDYVLTTGIEEFQIEFEEYEEDPISRIVDRLVAEPDERHYVVVPPLGSKWRNEITLDRLISAFRHAGLAALDLVTQRTQKFNKEKLLRNPDQHRIIIVCRLGREGTDWVPCSRIHNASPEQSITLAVQTAGRAFRRYQGKRIVKLIHYVPVFPEACVDFREMLTDRTNALLLMMYWDDEANPIFIEETEIREKTQTEKPRLKVSLQTIFGDDWEKAKLDLINGYELLRAKVDLRILAGQICQRYGIHENLDSIIDAMVVKLIRFIDPRFDRINVAWLRENGFDKINFRNSLFFSSVRYDDWQQIRKLIRQNFKKDQEESQERRVKAQPYPEIGEAIGARQRLGINTAEEYRDRYSEDARLPPNPHIYYRRKRQWQGWDHFFG